jgi:hypothetical protein
VLAALAASFGCAFSIFREVSRATLMPLTALLATAGMAAVAVFTTLAPGLSRELMIFREAALFGRHALPAPASGLGRALGIIREVPAAGLAALAGNVPLLFSSIDAKPRFEVWDWSRSAIIKTSKLWSVRHRSNALDP